MLKGEISGARNRFGFTLVELLVVVVIIAILAAIAIPKFTNAGQRSTEAAVRTQLSIVRNAVNQYQQDTGWWPTSLNDLSATTCPTYGLNNGGQQKPIIASNWNGPYLSGQDIEDYNSWVSYDTTPPGTGSVFCTQSGAALDGSLYSSW